jgi:hypothetical protein
MLFMISRLETVRESMIEEAISPVMDALVSLDDGQNSEGVSQGAINKEVRRLYPDRKLGMGIIPTALDALEEKGAVTCIETPIDPSKNGHTIGVPTWKSLGYHVAESPPGFLQTVSEVLNGNYLLGFLSAVRNGESPKKE